MKCFSTCMAQLLGLIYEGSKFWEERIEKLLSTVKVSQVYQDFRSIANKFSMSLLKRGADNLDTLQMIKNQQSKEQAWKSTLFVNEALDKFMECNQKMKDYNSKGECSFIHDFIKCFTNKSDSLEKFWNKDFRSIFDPRDYSRMVAMSAIMNNNGSLNFSESEFRKYVQVVNKISYAEDVISSRCTYRYLRPKILTFKEACLAIVQSFVPTPVGNVFMYKLVNKEERYPPFFAAATCARANGSLVTVTESSISSLKILNKLLRNATKSGPLINDASDLYSNSILLDETYLDSENVTRWCSTSEEMPKSLFDPMQENPFHLYVNYNAEFDSMYFMQSGIMSEDDNLFDVPVFFCAFDESFLTLCKKRN
ncbi:uncharacterized protein LOC135947232 [Cloeon dipterum]|uniref:uncharacterized protein LOC135947232 n=1 Tax=Cloeon dipterum TaxID=197152 RepID=UPI00321F82E5